MGFHGSISHHRAGSQESPVFEVVTSDVWTNLGTETGENTLIANYLWAFCFVF